ncbi:MAG: hypothetical protein ABW148_05045 [Sedimenticola sp.]
MIDKNNSEYSAEILMVDDIPENSKLLRGLLSVKGYKICPATSVAT